jgi:hypothetical protein
MFRFDYLDVIIYTLNKSIFKNNLKNHILSGGIDIKVTGR